MRLHVISPFHTKNQQYFSHCAFTGKSLRFPKMMKQYGYEVIEYSNEGSESMADEHVQILNHDEFNSFYGADNISSFEPLAIIGGPGHICFHERLIEKISNRIEPNDIICHTFGHAHENLKNIFPNNFHVETGIGYPTIMDGTFHIFESYAWLHHYHGIKGTGGSNYEWVVPNYYDLDDWVPNYEHGKYLSFMGRVVQSKGLSTIFAIADNSKYPIFIHGHGDCSAYNHPNVKFLGPIFGKDRSDFIRNSRALLAPTTFIEPFCGMAVESMLCGTPVISVDYGAMTETVEEGMGFRCHTLQDWLDAVNDVEKLDRNYIANKARNKYSLEACGKKYDKIFKQLDDLKNKKGWYQINNEVNNYNQHVDYETEKSFWNDCTNTFGEDEKHYVYAKHMNLKQDYHSFDVGGKSILDLGGGPTSMLLKTINLKKGKVIDPIEYPKWTIERYNSKNIDVLVDIGENVNEEGWDEVWIYNCLQHVIDPQKIIENAKKSAKVLRIFEWINIPPHDGHPHCLTKENLDAWIGGSGNTTQLAESNCYGECYYGEFSFECDDYDKFFNKLESDDIFFVIVGAMDGVNHDNTFKYAFKNKHWKGLLIEPMRDYFQKLNENYEYRENLIFENVAISDSEGYEYMFRIPSKLIESGEVTSWSDVISTFYPEKNAMREEHLISKAVKEPVLCTTFENISNKHSIEKIDVLQIDVEGCDSNVFWQIWNLNYRPKLIIIETVNMQSEEKNNIEEILKNNSYNLSYNGDNLIATKENLL